MGRKWGGKKKKVVVVGQGEMLSSDLKNLDVYRENLLNLIQFLQILVPVSFCQRQRFYSSIESRIGGLIQKVAM